MALKFRLKEYKKYVENQVFNNPVTSQDSQEEGHIFDFESAHILFKPSCIWGLNFLELHYIHKLCSAIVNSNFAVFFFRRVWCYF